MAALTLSNQVSHPPLSRYVIEKPREKSDALMSKSRWHAVAAKVCMAAFLAIAAVAISISIGIAIPMPAALLIALVIGTVPLQIANTHFRASSAAYEVLAAAERGKANELEKIQNWTCQDIKSFLKEHRILESSLPMGDLKKIDSKEPLRALLPAIARYRYWQQQTETQFLRYQANLHNKSEVESLRTAGRIRAWSILEDQVVPAALQAALMLQIIAQPTLQVAWENLGECKMKSFDQRMFDRWLDRSDEYFVFQEPNRPRLNLEELCALIDPLKIDDLRLKLFPA